MRMRGKTIETVVENRMCTGCGTCTVACPNGAIAMQESPAGFPRPMIDESLCNECGLCLSVCSGVHYLFSLPEDVDSLLMPKPRKVYLARANDEQIHTLGQSGGLITGLLAYLLDTEQISHALVTRMPGDGSLRPEAYFARTRKELMESVGSKYCQNPLNETLRRWPEDSCGVAMVGLPCHIHGIRNLERMLRERWENAFELVIGLFCMQAGGYRGIDYLLRHRVKDIEVRRIHHRRKTAAGERGCPAIEYADGTYQDFPVDFLWEFFNHMWSPLRCRFCFDQMNRMSDIAVGDPNGYSEQVLHDGLTVAAVYTERGQKFLKEAEQNGALMLQESDVKTMWAGQNVATQRKERVLRSYAQWRKLKRVVPEEEAMEKADLIRVPWFVRWTLKFLWQQETVQSRQRAYRRVVRWRCFWKFCTKWKRRLMGQLQKEGVCR